MMIAYEWCSGYVCFELEERECTDGASWLLCESLSAARARAKVWLSADKIQLSYISCFSMILRGYQFYGGGSQASSE